MAGIDAAVAARAAQQLGLISVHQASELGLTRAMRRARVEQGTLEHISPTVLRVAGMPPSWRQRVLAACLEAGAEAVASHRTAAALWGLDGAGRGVPEITVARGHRPRRVPGIVHTARDLLRVDTDHRGVIPLTTPSRTLIDCAAVVPYAVLETMLDSAARDGLVRESYLRWRIAELRSRGRPGIGAIEQALGPRPGAARAHTWLERQTVRLFAAAGLPPPKVQAHLRKHGGGVARVDHVWEEVRVIVEVSGHRTHSTRRQRQADAERTARLRLAGWTVIEFTYEDVTERPGYVCRTTAAALGLGGHGDGSTRRVTRRQPVTRSALTEPFSSPERFR